jgi:hypothetical protein
MRNFQLKLIVLHLLFVGIVSGQVRPNAHPSQITMVTTSASDSVTVNLTVPSDVHLNTLSVHLNGKDVSAKLTPAACAPANCQQATLTAGDGLHERKNVFWVIAKRNDGSLVSTRTRFVGMSAAARAKADIKSSEVAQTSDVAALPTLSSFLPPAIAVNTLTPGGYKNGSPWIEIGSQNTYPADPASVSCANNIYLVVVLDRQTLQEKTAAPESSPQCISNGAALKTYLASLSAGDLVIVGSNAFFNSDAGTGSGQLDTSAIGGSVYNCVGGTSCASVPANTVTSPDVPLGYIAIGVGGAASGSAYEYYYQANDPWVVIVPYATGTLVEDSSGNYNFQTANAIEYTVTPNDPAQGGLSSISVNSVPGDANFNAGLLTRIYTPPVAAGTNGIWVLKLQRSTLFSIPFDMPTNPPPVSDGDACTGTITSTIAFLTNCGRFYATGNPSSAVAAGAYSALADDLASQNTNELVFLVTIGNQPGFPKVNSTIIPSEVANAFSLLGGTPETLIGLTKPGSTYSYVGCVTCGNSLGGHVVISTNLQLGQGQNGYIHGLLQPNLNGLFWPTQASLDQPDTNGAPTTDFTIQEVTATQPADWPELSTTQKLTSGTNTADSTTGQNAAYYYISYQLINLHYIIGAQGNNIDDMHYYFTGGSNTFLDYHSYDPINLTFPGTTPATCFQWTDPVPVRGALACFTQNDFNAVRDQMHNEILYLTNVLQFMVNGSTNMKDIVASGGGSAALALINAAAAVQASTLQPPPARQVKSNVSNILNLVGNIVSTAATIATAALGLPEATAGIKLALQILGPAAGVTTGSFGMASAITGGLHTAVGPAPIPSRDYPFLTTIGDLSSNQLQQGFTAGFDSGLDTLLSDWFKLSIIGPKITDSNNPGFQTPTQSTQLIGITQIGQASQRSFYMALLPVDYSVQHYTYWFGDPSITNEPDMGARTDGAARNCNTWYYVAPAPPTINLVSKSYFSYSDEGPTQFAFWYDTGTQVPNPMPLDWYILASSSAAAKAGTSEQQIQLLDPQVATTLFSASQLDIPLDPFLDIAGPMASVWADAATSKFTNFPAMQTCSLYVAGKYGNSNPPSGGTVGSPENAVQVALSIPATGVLGDNIALKAAAAAAGSPVTSGTIAFSDGSLDLGRAALDGTGTATLTVTTLALGTHTIRASFVASQQFTATTPVSASLIIYANDPDLALAPSATNLSVISGAASSPLAIQVTSKWGLAGTVAFTCSGLPAGAACSFTPSQVTLTDGSSASTSLTISNQKHTAQLGPSLPLFAVILLPLPLLLLRWRNTAMKSLCAIMVVGMLLSLGFLAGCGGGSSTPPPATQPKTSTVLVTATSGNISRSAPINLTLQ